MEVGSLSNRGWKSKWRIAREMYRSCIQHGHPTSWLRLLMRLTIKDFSEVLRRERA